MDDEIGSRALTKISLEVIEAAIADALTELSGRPFSASLKRLDLHPSLTAETSDEYEIIVRVRRDFGPSAAVDLEPAEARSDAEKSASEPVPAAQVSDRTVTGLTGRQLNHEWNVGARHALYHHEGRWYHKLRQFPGALFDFNGYVVFETKEAFERCPDINITQDVHVPRGLASMRDYVKVR